jgi:hypothetical protein
MPQIGSILGSATSECRQNVQRITDLPLAVSSHRLLAEAEAWPLTSIAAYNGRTLRLARVRLGVLDGPTQRLADALEEHLRHARSGASLDTLSQLRDSAWLLDTKPSVLLVEYTQALAARYLTPHGGTTRLTETPTLPERAGRWRWLSLLLPPDLLIAALAADGSREPPGEEVDLSTPHLAKLLEEPVAETHLHLGASAPFPILWTSLMGAMAHEPPGASNLDRGGPPPFGSGKAFRTMLTAAATGRILLAAFLWRYELTGAPANFTVFWKTGATDIHRRMAWPLGEDDARQWSRRALRLLSGEQQDLPFAWAQSFYRHLAGRPGQSEPHTLSDIVQSDPLSTWLPGRIDAALPETRFTARAFRYLSVEGRSDTGFGCVFWQYIRVRGLLYRHLVQAAGTAGLEWFSRHFSRIAAVRRSLDPVLGAAAIRYGGAGLRLAAIEVRTSPSPAWTAIRDEVRALARHAIEAQAGSRTARSRTGNTLCTTSPRTAASSAPVGIPPPEVGLLFHFIKARDFVCGGLRWRHADPGLTGFRFGKWVSDRWKEALAIEHAIRNEPELLLVFRGLDVANLERAIPTWAAVPLFDRVRRASVEASARLQARRPRWRVPPLRMTYHAGEDFFSLMEGIRRVHEPLEVGILRTGDRVGHGLAIAVNPDSWAERARIVPQPLEDRLDDLVWELERYGHNELRADGSRVAYAAAEALRIARDLYGTRMSIDVDALILARRMRHEPRRLERLGFPFFSPSEPLGTGHADRLLFAYLTDRAVFERGQRLIEITADAEETAVARIAQRFVRHLLSRLEITVETNPSSNLLIADMHALEEHPLFRMQPLSFTDGMAGDVAVLASINSDDPITFATRLADEYAHIHLALLRMGIDSREVLAWLDRLRAHGFRSRFTLPASADAAELACLLRDR